MVNVGKRLPTCWWSMARRMWTEPSPPRVRLWPSALTVIALSGKVLQAVLRTMAQQAEALQAVQSPKIDSSINCPDFQARLRRLRVAR